jgi:hypothetical protein
LETERERERDKGAINFEDGNKKDAVIEVIHQKTKKGA